MWRFLIDPSTLKSKFSISLCLDFGSPVYGVVNYVWKFYPFIARFRRMEEEFFFLTCKKFALDHKKTLGLSMQKRDFHLGAVHKLLLTVIISKFWLNFETISISRKIHHRHLKPSNTKEKNNKQNVKYSLLTSLS